MTSWRARTALGCTVIAAVAGVTAARSSATSTTTANTATASRPNIVFVLTDDLSTNLIEHMPHVQSMIASGTSFSNYFVTDSLCCPSRASIFTGELPHNTGVFSNAGADGGYEAYNRNGNEAKSFAVAMQQVGYRTGLMGKYLNQYRPESDPPAPGWDEWDVAGHAYNEFNYVLNENGTPRSYGSAPSDYLTDVLAGKAQSFVESSAEKGQPFMLEVAPFSPHAPYVPAPRYANAANDVHLKHTPAYGMLPTNAPTWMRGLPPVTASDDERYDTIYRQRVRADLAVDDLIAGLQRTLLAKGIAGNTYFVFSSDNGLHLGDYRLDAGKKTAFDTDIHVPFVVTGPGVAAGRTVDDMVSNIDIAPTFAQVAGYSKRAGGDGVSVLGLLRGDRAARWQKALLVEHHQYTGQDDPDRQPADSGDPPDYEALRTTDALLVRYTQSGEYEYYDLRRDPWELHNVPDQAPTALKQQLQAMSECVGAACQQLTR